VVEFVSRNLISQVREEMLSQIRLQAKQLKSGRKRSGNLVKEQELEEGYSRYSH